MARVLTEGFEFGDLLFFNVIDQYCTAYATANARSGAYAMRVNSSAGTRWCTKVISALSEAYFRFGIRMNSLPDSSLNGLFRLRNDANELVSLRVSQALGAWQMYVGTSKVAQGLTPIRVDKWYLIEFHVKISDTVGVLEMRIDGDVEMTYNGDTKPGAYSTFDNFMMGSPQSGVEILYDDFAMNDTSGLEDNSYPDDGYILLLKPDGTGDASELTGSDGNQVDNYDLVNDIPSDGDTSYVVESTLDLRDLYTLEDFTPTGVDILRIWMEARARETISDGGEIALVLKTGGVEFTSGDISMLTTYTKQILSEEYKLNPYTGGAWITAELNALQAGPKIR